MRTTQGETLRYGPAVAGVQPATTVIGATRVGGSEPVFASRSPLRQKVFSLAGRSAPALFAVWLLALGLGVTGSSRLPTLAHPSPAAPALPANAQATSELGPKQVPAGAGIRPTAQPPTGPSQIQRPAPPTPSAAPRSWAPSAAPRVAVASSAGGSSSAPGSTQAVPTSRGQASPQAITAPGRAQSNSAPQGPPPTRPAQSWHR